jgi:hypothetical protein
MPDAILKLSTAVATAALVASMLAACSGGSYLSTGSIGGAQAPKPVTPSDRALYNAANIARAQRCGFVLPADQLRANYLAAETQAGTPPDVIAKVTKGIRLYAPDDRRLDRQGRRLLHRGAQPPDQEDARASARRRLQPAGQDRGRRGRHTRCLGVAAHAGGVQSRGRVRSSREIDQEGRGVRPPSAAGPSTSSSAPVVSCPLQPSRLPGSKCC